MRNKKIEKFVVHLSYFVVLLAVWLMLLLISIDLMTQQTALHFALGGKILVAGVGILIGVILYRRYSYLRPEWKRERPILIILRTVNVLCQIVALTFFLFLIYQFLTIPARAIVMFNEAITAFSFAGISLILEKFIIPAARISKGVVDA